LGERRPLYLFECLLIYFSVGTIGGLPQLIMKFFPHFRWLHFIILELIFVVVFGLHVNTFQGRHVV